MKQRTIAVVAGMMMAMGVGSAWASEVGVIVKAGGGRVAGALVSVGAKSKKTDSDGVAAFEDVAAGSHKVTVTLHCFNRSGQATAVRRKTVVVEVPDKKSIDVPIEIERCPTGSSPTNDEDTGDDGGDPD